MPIIINNNSLHHETRYISLDYMNNDKILAPIIQLYVLIFNVGKYNIHINYVLMQVDARIFTQGKSEAQVCGKYTFLI